MFESCSNDLPIFRSAPARLKSDSTVDRLMSLDPTSWFAKAWAVCQLCLKVLSSVHTSSCLAQGTNGGCCASPAPFQLLQRSFGAGQLLILVQRPSADDLGQGRGKNIRRRGRG